MVRLARPRSGHFDLRTGYHGDLWLDLDALFLRPSRLRPHVRWLGVPLYPASTVPSRAWPAERCPLCADGIPYTDPVPPPEGGTMA